MIETTLYVGYLSMQYMKQLREDIKNTRGGFIDNSYIWIQYKDGSSFVLSNDGFDKMPCLDAKKILYVTTWYPPYGELYINPALGHYTQEDILRDAIYDVEDGHEYYTYVEFNKNFPYKSFDIRKRL